MSQAFSPLAAARTLAWRAIERLPPEADAVLRGARGLADAALSRPLPLRLLEGETGAGAGRLVLGGRGGSLGYFASRFFSGDPLDTGGGRIARRDVPERLPGADLAICRLKRRAAFGLEGRGVVRAPEAVGAHLAVAGERAVVGHVEGGVVDHHNGRQ